MVRVKKKAKNRFENILFSDKTPIEVLYEKDFSEWTPVERCWWEKYVLPIIRPSNRGRPKEVEHDRALAERELAQALGLRVPTYRELARPSKESNTTSGALSEAVLRGESAIRDPKVDALMKAVRRRVKKRQIPNPPRS